MRPLRSTGTISRVNLPAAMASQALRWLRTAQASAASRVMPSSRAAVSAQAIMELSSPKRSTGWDMTRAR